MFQKDLVYTNQCKSTLSKNDGNDPEKDIICIYIFKVITNSFACSSYQSSGRRPASREQDFKYI